jgi:predicted transcriptional regulator
MTTTLGIKIDDEIRVRLKTLSQSRNHSTHQIMKNAILRYLDHEEEIERRNTEADHAWKEYQETGQYVSHEDMTAWLDTWGTDREIECPNITNQP